MFRVIHPIHRRRFLSCPCIPHRDCPIRLRLLLRSRSLLPALFQKVPARRVYWAHCLRLALWGMVLLYIPTFRTSQPIPEIQTHLCKRFARGYLRPMCHPILALRCRLRITNRQIHQWSRNIATVEYSAACQIRLLRSPVLWSRPMHKQAQRGRQIVVAASRSRRARRF